MNSVLRQQVRAFGLVGRLLGRLGARIEKADRDRGDVPGWVMVTIMTAGLVVALWAIARQRLGDIFDSALQQVVGGPN